MSELIVSSEASFRSERHHKAISDTIGSKLATLYPGYKWRVEVYGGIADASCVHASGRAGYTFNLVRDGIPDNAAIMRAGGVVLERFKLNRRAFDEHEYRSLPRFCGLLLPEW